MERDQCVEHHKSCALRMMRLLSGLVFFSTWSCHLIAGASVPDHKGREFVLAFGANYYSTDADVELFITTEEQDVGVNVSVPLLPHYPVYRLTVSNGLSASVNYSKDVRLCNVSLENKGILIQSSADVVVYATNKATSSVDAFLVLPTDILGTLYYIPSYPGAVETTGQPLVGPQAGFIAVHDNTTVTASFPADRNHGNWLEYDGRSISDGDSLTVVLNRYQTFQLQTKNDLTGARVVSNKPLALVAGNKRTYVPWQLDRSSDHLEEMVPPVNTWGRHFITVPFTGRRSGDIFRILGSEDFTAVNVTKAMSGESSIHWLSAGGFIELNVSSDEYLSIVANNSVFLYQLSKSRDSDEADSDPMMVLIPPTEQFDNGYSFVTVKPVNDAYHNFVNIIIDAKHFNGLRLNSKPVPKFQNHMYTHLNATYSIKWRNSSYYERNWTAVSDTGYLVNTLFVLDGSHVLSHEDPTVSFGAIMYGQVKYESYGYPAGLRLVNTGSYCVKNTTVTTPGDGIDNDCDGRVDEEVMNGRDDDGDGLVDEDLTDYLVITRNNQEATQTTTPSTRSSTEGEDEDRSTSSARASTNGREDEDRPTPEANTALIVGTTVPILLLAIIAGSICFAWAFIKRRRKKKDELLAKQEAESTEGENGSAASQGSSVEGINNADTTKGGIMATSTLTGNGATVAETPSGAKDAPLRQASRPSLRSNRVSPAP